MERKRYYSVDLVVNGVSRAKKTTRAGLGSIPRSNSSGNVTETTFAMTGDEESQAILSEWMSFYNTSTPPTAKNDDIISSTPLEDDNRSGGGNSNKEEEANENITTEVASSGQIVLEVGSGAFHGRVRSMAVCARLEKQSFKDNF